MMVEMAVTITTVVEGATPVRTVVVAKEYVVVHNVLVAVSSDASCDGGIGR